MKRKPSYGHIHEYESKKHVIKPKKTEPYVLYIKHSLTEPYVLVGQFDSSVEAHRYLDETYSGFPHKIMSVKAAIAEGKRLEARAQRRREMMSKAKEKVISGAKAVGRGAQRVAERAAEQQAYEQPAFTEQPQQQPMSTPQRPPRDYELERKRQKELEDYERQLQHEQQLALEKEKLRMKYQGGGLQMPNIWSGQPRGYTPAQPQQRQSLYPPQRQPSNFNPPNIWQRKVTQPEPPVKKKSKKKRSKKKSKKRKK